MPLLTNCFCVKSATYSTHLHPSIITAVSCMFTNIEKLYAQLHHIYIRHPSNLLKFMISYFFLSES